MPARSLFRCPVFGRRYARVALLLALAVGGCEEKQPVAPPPEPPPPVPEEVRGTLAEYASLIGGGSYPVQGYCLVVGLGKNGSTMAPPAIEQYLTTYLAKKHLGSSIYGTMDISPEVLIRDPDTAVVTVSGQIPPGSPKGSRFDLVVDAIPQTDTRRLDGGILMPTELHRTVAGAATVGSGTPVVAVGSGSLFTNPFADPAKETDHALFLSGRVVGGGVVVQSRPILMQLYRGDYALCRQMVDRINGRFRLSGQPAVARGLNDRAIEIEVPRRYYDDYDDFTQLLMHVPLSTTGAALDSMAQRVAQLMEQPTARHEDLALIWEAIGAKTIPTVSRLYTSANPLVAFYAGRTGLRLGDRAGGEVVLRFVQSANPTLRLKAIQELARHSDLYKAEETLAKCLDDSDEVVRLAAYRAMCRRGDRRIISLRVGTDEADSVKHNGTCEFVLDMVPSTRDPVVYATQTTERRIALFGKDIALPSPSFFNAADDLLTLNVRKGETNAVLFRKIVRGDFTSPPYTSSLRLSDMVLTMGTRPQIQADGKVKGMGLTYGQIVWILRQMCDNGVIPAKFVLQQPTELTTIQKDVAGEGRPDVSP